MPEQSPGTPGQWPDSSLHESRARNLDTADRPRDSEIVWNGYSARDAAAFVGLPESAIRGCVRAGFVVPDTSAVPMRFSFRDLRILQAVKALASEGIPLRRVLRQLSALQKRLPHDVSLAELSLGAHGCNVVVREECGAWLVDSGQMVFTFGDNTWRGKNTRHSNDNQPGNDDTGPGEIRAMPIRREAPGPQLVAAASAEEWLERAVLLEEIDSKQAIEAYERALELRPDSLEAWVNLGRLYAEAGHIGDAETCFRSALAIDPTDSTTLYNLGVVSQDAGKDEVAIAYYERALCIDALLAEAHYNLATIHDRQGDTSAAIRHINAYRKLISKAR